MGAVKVLHAFHDFKKQKKMLLSYIILINSQVGNGYSFRDNIVIWRYIVT